MKFTSLFFPASESIFDLSKIQKKHICHSERSEESRKHQLYAHEILRRYAPLDDKWIYKKAIVRKSENSRWPNGVLFKSILCLDFFPVSLSEETYSSQ